MIESFCHLDTFSEIAPRASRRRGLCLKVFERNVSMTATEMIQVLP